MSESESESVASHETSSNSGMVCAECQQPADLKCSACKLVAYCCKEHQKQHWKTHKSLCRPFKVRI